MDDVRLYIVKFKLRFQRGTSWVSYFMPILYLIGITNPEYIRAHLIQIGFIYIVSCYSIGWLDESSWGIWKLENVYGSVNLNPAIEELCDNVKEKK